MAKLKIQHTRTGGAGYEASATIVEDSYVSPTKINGTNIGGTGGDNDQTVPTIRIRFYDGSTLQTGYIITQKGTRDFRVNTTADSGTTTVTLVNKQSGELATANTATILCNVATIQGANVANIGAGVRTSAYITWIAANVTGYQAPLVGHQLTGTALTGNVTVTAVNSATNVTVSCADQTVTNAQANISQAFNVKRITNKFVSDWSDNKFRYYLGQPYNTGTTLSSQPAWQGVVLVNVDNN